MTTQTRRSSRTRRTQRQKLIEAVSLTRDKLAAGAVAEGMWPDGRHQTLFSDYSKALRELVAYHLAAPEWDAEGDAWRWDDYEHVFSFDYVGRCELAQSGKPRDCDLLWCRARMALDPKKDLEAELARLGALAVRFRERIEFLERETLRYCPPPRNQDLT